MEEFKDVLMVSQPENLDISLFPHQLSAIKMLESRESVQEIMYDSNSIIETNVGVYADITGYGKTLSIIGLILRDKMEWDMKKIYKKICIKSIYGNGIITKKNIQKYERINCNLIVANQSLVKQWKKEFSHTNLKIITITRKKQIDFIIPSDYDVIIISYTMYNTLVTKFRNISWKRFIFDEPTHTHIPSMRPVVAGFYWFITATPDLLSCFNFRVPSSHFLYFFSAYMHSSLFNKLIVKNKDDFVKLSFNIPQPEHKFYKCYQPLFNAIRGIVPSFISEMVSAGNIEGAIKTLGGNDTSNIIELIKKKKEEKLEECNFKIQIYENRDENCGKQLKFWKDKKEVYVRQIEGLNEKFKNILENGQCNICFENFEEPVLLSCCQNLFCGKCILQWLKEHDTCPLCRCNLKVKEHIIYINNSKIKREYKKIERKKTKLETIINIISNNKNKKFIIFSSYCESFNIIRNVLSDNNISYSEIRGQYKTRNRNIDKFKNGKLRVLFLNSKSNGAGINLQEATDIILYHRMSDSFQKQIIGRVNRIGKKGIVKVHHLI